MITVDGKKSFDLSSGQYSPAQQKLNRSLRFNKILLFKNKASIRRLIDTNRESHTTPSNQYLPCMTLGSLGISTCSDDGMNEFLGSADWLSLALVRSISILEPSSLILKSELIVLFT